MIFGQYMYQVFQVKFRGDRSLLLNFTLLSFCGRLEAVYTVFRKKHPLTFLARDSMLSALYAIARPSVRPSVCLSVTRVDQSKTVKRIIEILSPSDRTNILVFGHQRSLRKSDGFTPNGGAKYKGGSKN